MGIGVFLSLPISSDLIRVDVLLRLRSLDFYIRKSLCLGQHLLE